MGSIVEALSASATHRVKQAEVDAKRTVQGAYNEKEAATASLARYAQSVGNQRKLEAAGKALNAQADNINAALDNATVGTFAQRVQVASELGAATAAAAAANVGGGSVDAYRRTVQLNAAINEQARQAAVDSGVIGAKDAMGDTIKNAVASLSNDQFAGDFDYTRVLDHVEQKFSVLDLGRTALATYFGGPKAGMATIDIKNANNRFANGDISGGTASLNSAIRQGFGAFKNASILSAAESNSGASSGFWNSKFTDYFGKS